MIDYIPPDIPPAIVKYADEHYKKPEDAVSRVFKYLTVWKGNLELYITDWRYKSLGNDPRTGEPIMRIVGLPTVLVYDCKDVRRPILEEMRDIYYFLPIYLKNINSEHICHRDLETFNKYKTPNPYKQKPKYVTPKYIPKPVVKYVNDKYPVSWYPGFNTRYIKYLTTYEDKYETYIVFWENPKTKKQSFGKYVLFDCKNVREYQNNKEKIDLIFLSQNQYESTAKPNFCKIK